MITLWHLLFKLKIMFYKITIHWPRPLPRTQQQFFEMKYLLATIGDLPHDETTAVIIASQIENVKPPKMKVSYAFLIAMVQRFLINKMLHEEKVRLYQAKEDIEIAKRASLELSETKTGSPLDDKN